MAVLSFTPLMWILMGRPSESYPELLFIGFGLPLGVAFVCVAAWRFWKKNRRMT
jgi:hypothetical protein